METRAQGKIAQGVKISKLMRKAGVDTGVMSGGLGMLRFRSDRLHARNGWRRVTAVL